MIVIELIYNLAVLVAVSVVSGFIDARWQRGTRKGQVLQGITFGLIATIAMLNPFILAPGIIFDGRSIVISLCALFFGPAAAVIATSMAVVTRVIIGGGGMIMGVSVILSSMAIGLLANLARKKTQIPISAKLLYLLGLAVHIMMLILMFYLPYNFVWLTFQTVAISVIIFYPAATVLIGKVLSDQENNRKLLAELIESGNNFRSLYENAPVGLYRTAPDGKLLLANKALLDMLGCSSAGELSGKYAGNNDGPFYSRREFIGQVESSGEVKGLEEHWRRKDNEQIILKVNAKAIRETGGHTIYYDGTVQDVTERRLSEEKISASLREKEILLKEVHHRVKNNLQIISSLLSLQSGYIEDNKNLKIFTESMNRIKSMAIIHEKLYLSESLGSIEAMDYLNALTGYLFRTYAVRHDLIDSCLEIENITLPIDTAIPFGLIANELIANALEHAFPAGSKGSITVKFSRQGDECRLVVKDDGKGLPENFKPEESKSLGLMLVHSLAEQLKGRIEMKSRGGVECSVSFPVK